MESYFYSKVIALCRQLSKYVSLNIYRWLHDHEMSQQHQMVIVIVHDEEIRL